MGMAGGFPDFGCRGMALDTGVAPDINSAISDARDRVGFERICVIDMEVGGTDFVAVVAGQ